jgi:hypothetical protein
MYQTSIQTVAKDADSGIFTLYTKNSEDSDVEYQCQTVIWAAGLSKPRIFENTLITPYHDVLPASHYKNKSVAIIGSGQAAFELARDIYKVSASTMIMYRSAPKFAYNTHYVGDLRAINHEIVDSYQLKSLGTYEQLWIICLFPPFSNFVSQTPFGIVYFLYHQMFFRISSYRQIKWTHFLEESKRTRRRASFIWSPTIFICLIPSYRPLAGLWIKTPCRS